MTEAVRLEPLPPPDADFEALRLEAVADLAASQAAAVPAWTDHNAADPGITILEVALWALADLHYRAAERGWDVWSAEAQPWRDVPLPRGRSAREAAAAVLADPSGAATVRLVLANAPSRARATLDVRAALGSSPEEAGAIVRLAREPLVLEAAFDCYGQLEEAVATAPSPPDAVLAAAAAVSDLGLREDEAPELVAYVRRTRFAGLFDEREAALRSLVDLAPDQAGALAALAGPFTLADGSSLTLSPPEQKVALALHPCPPAAPELWERAGGATTLWPPHPLQARTCEPVTAEDYRRLALFAPDVRRAWVVPGLALGVAWDGRDQAPVPDRRGALTLLIEPGGDPPSPLDPVGTPLTAADRTRLEQLLRDTVGVETTGGEAGSEVDDPFPDFRDDLDAAWPRRLLGDELAAALLTVLPVAVRGLLELSPTAREADALAAAEALLGRFLSSDRIAPFEPPPGREPPLDCPRAVEGPWPRADASRAFVAHPHGETPPGWPPGAPVRQSEVVQLLTGIPGVLGVAELELAADAAAPAWTPGDLDVPPYSVPSFVRHCLCTRIFDPRACGA